MGVEYVDTETRHTSTHAGRSAYKPTLGMYDNKMNLSVILYCIEVRSLTFRNKYMASIWIQTEWKKNRIKEITY
jgi:hypothetical protein